LAAEEAVSNCAPAVSRPSIPHESGASAKGIL
jgi:hypothetical protein